MYRSPILKVGQFGTHIMTYPTGRWGFFGAVPTDLKDKSYSTKTEAEEDLVAWAKENDIEINPNYKFGTEE